MSRDDLGAHCVDLVWIIRLVKDKCEEGFFGTIALKFEEGRMTHARVEEVLKPPLK